MGDISNVSEDKSNVLKDIMNGIFVIATNRMLKHKMLCHAWRSGVPEQVKTNRMPVGVF